MPEALWKAYIDFEISSRERQRTRILYERLLDRTKHVKVGDMSWEGTLRQRVHVQYRGLLGRTMHVYVGNYCA